MSNNQQRTPAVDSERTNGDDVPENAEVETRNKITATPAALNSGQVPTLNGASNLVLNRIADRLLVAGKADLLQCDNKVISARYTALTFLPVAILEQFRRFANMYFLTIGLIMFIGTYTALFESAISPWTTLGPLSVVVTISLLVEGNADYKRHCNDAETNNTPCVILSRADDMQLTDTNNRNEKPKRDEHIMNGKDVVVNLNSTRHKNPDPSNITHIAFQKIKRMHIRQGHFVLVKNREMVPADIILLASSNDQGCAYIETSSIDGETNLKLRTTPTLPPISKSLSMKRSSQQRNPSLGNITEEALELAENEHDANDTSEDTPKIETIDAATKRLTKISALGRPKGVSALYHPSVYSRNADAILAVVSENRLKKGNWIKNLMNMNNNSSEVDACAIDSAAPKENLPHTSYVATLTSEPPNASVHTFSGKLTLPAVDDNSACNEIPLGAENVLLRGAVIRNTEWVIGLAFFTGKDTKLVQNSFKTPSKFSQLDVLMNKTVLVVLTCMALIIIYLATSAVYENFNKFDTLFYVGFNKDVKEPWPYLPTAEFSDVKIDWKPQADNWLQYVLLYITLMNNFIPLSLYVTIELITYCMIWFVNNDIEMYDDTTNTRAVARSNIVSDLGRIQYIFSDKTGTLTQNVMRFKRCSVDGIVFGAPIPRSRPGETSEEAKSRRSKLQDKYNVEDDDHFQEDVAQFLPLRQLLVGKVPKPSNTYKKVYGLENYNHLVGDSMEDKRLTFNSEMFLRAMSLCHTVVVEKDIDKKEQIDSGMSVASSTRSGAKSITGMAKSLFNKASASVPGSNSNNNRKRADTGGSLGLTSPLGSVAEEGVFADENLDSAIKTMNANRVRTSSVNSLPYGQTLEFQKSDDGAPMGYAYQAESPDEGALVSAASQTFGFQVIERDTNGIRLRCSVPSAFQETSTIQKLKHHQVTLRRLAAQSASTHESNNKNNVNSLGHGNDSGWNSSSQMNEIREETWSIIAINKFDSDRKRMSILLRSPPELGNLPILFCKGADSAMLQADVCENSHLLLQPVSSDNVRRGRKKPKHERDVSALTSVSEDEDDYDEEDDDVFNQEEWEVTQMLNIQVHLGEFAKEGLRTLVLGMKILTEEECTTWMQLYKTASTSMTNRSELLTEAAKDIESGLHIVGATAIEDKLQKRVPETIATLEKAGIKLWVLTGDKRETAVEIGYSTHVLTPKMHLTEVPDQGKQYVRTQLAMEFIRLTKIGRLPEYQKYALDNKSGKSSMKERWRERVQRFLFKIETCHRAFNRLKLRWEILVFTVLQLKVIVSKRKAKLKESLEGESLRMLEDDRRRKVRARAEKTIRKWLQSDAGKEHRKIKDALREPLGLARSREEILEDALATEETPIVFTRATSAQTILTDMKNSGDLTAVDLRKYSLAHLTATQVSSKDINDRPLVDEDTLSLESFVPTATGDLRGDFDKKKRTIFERCFAIDRDVRKGRLKKHLTEARLEELFEKVNKSDFASSTRSLGDLATKVDAVRALVIEGSALKHLLGEPDFEQILFAVASNCNAVIACRVSPKQKAELVRLVRRNIRPEPITLAIGDGANDVGMIQEAHVGIGISGKEGKQAVNASDFSIAQFRFLETLVLIHGRWNFFRLSTVVMFSFYKNTVMAGLIIIFSGQTVYSGTPLIDEWVIAMLNFVAAWPIVFLGVFDRCLSKDYVRKNPEVYKATRENELITFRTLFRWICLVFLHMCILYYFTVPQQSLGGGTTSAFHGLMRNNDEDWPGDGEGGDLKSVGTVTYTCMIFLFAYKVLLESRSLVHGRWPAFTCRKDAEEGFFSRVGYTWVGVVYLSLAFHFFSICMYSLVGRKGASQFSSYVGVAFQMITTRSMSWMLIAFVPIMAIAFDMTGKVFSNMFFPTQTQVHLEIEAYNKMQARLRGELPNSKRSPKQLGERQPRTRTQEQQNNAGNTKQDDIA